jgi:hypothetical protein
MLERMASLLFTEKGGEFAKDGVLSSAQNRGRTPFEQLCGEGAFNDLHGKNTV